MPSNLHLILIHDLWKIIMRMALEGSSAFLPEMRNTIKRWRNDGLLSNELMFDINYTIPASISASAAPVIDIASSENCINWKNRLVMLLHGGISTSSRNPSASSACIEELADAGMDRTIADDRTIECKFMLAVSTCNVTRLIAVYLGKSQRSRQRRRLVCFKTWGNQ